LSGIGGPNVRVIPQTNPQVYRKEENGGSIQYQPYLQSRNKSREPGRSSIQRVKEVKQGAPEYSMQCQNSVKLPKPRINFQQYQPLQD
jgi:hypothetical protein